MRYKEVEKHEHDYHLNKAVPTDYSKKAEAVNKRELVVRGFLFIVGLGLMIANSIFSELIIIIGIIGLVMVVMSLSDVIDRLRIQDSTPAKFANIEDSASFYELHNALYSINDLYVGRTPTAKIASEFSDSIKNQFFIVNPWENYLIDTYPKKTSYLSKRDVGVNLNINDTSYWKFTPEFITPQDYRITVTKHSSEVLLDKEI